METEGPKPPSLLPGVVLMVIAAVLMVVVIVGDPDTMPGWLRTSVAVAAVVVVVALIGFGIFVARRAGRRGR